MGLVLLSVVATETEAEYVCSLLRVFGVDCQHEESAIPSWRRNIHARDVFVDARQLSHAQQFFPLLTR